MALVKREGETEVTITREKLSYTIRSMVKESEIQQAKQQFTELFVHNCPIPEQLVEHYNKLIENLSENDYIEERILIDIKK